MGTKRSSRLRALMRLLPWVLLPAGLAGLLVLGAREKAPAHRAYEPVPVRTSRGTFPLRVYAPAKPGPGLPVLLISGEGGWRQFDERLAAYLGEDGFWVGGLDTRRYFWKPQDDRQVAAADFRAYAAALSVAARRPADSQVIVVGYSFGADVAPWIAGAGGWGGRVRGMILLGPDQIGSLESRVTEIIGIPSKQHVFRVADALRSSAGIPVAFVHGGHDSKSAAPDLLSGAPEPKKLLLVPGAEHHFIGHEPDLKTALSDALAWILATPAAAPPVESRR